jgi:hypothetical protein
MMMREYNRIDRDIRAAILWDAPHLWRSPGATRRFAQVLGLQPIEPAPREDREHPLEIASRGLLSAIEGRESEAREHYQQLLLLPGLAPLLGVALNAWLPSTRSDNEDRVIAALDPLDDWSLRSHYFCKFMTFSLDKGDRDAARRYWMEAFDSSHPRSALRSQLAIVGFNYFDKGVHLDSRRRRSLLVDYPWITELAAAGAREWQNLLARKRWPDRRTRTLRFGRAPIEDTLAAELQAAWAGALWLLPTIRRQLALQLTEKEQKSAEEARKAVAMWILGEARPIDPLVSILEQDFDGDSPDALIRDDLRNGKRVRERRDYLQLALCMWDLISMQEARELLEELGPADLGNPADDTGRRLFGTLAMRVPDQWASSYLSFDEDLRKSVVASVPPGAVASLDRRTQSRLLTDVSACLKGREAPANMYMVQAALWDVLSNEPREMAAIASAPAFIRVILAWNWAEFREQLNLREAVPALAEQVEEEMRAARAGRRGIGPFDPKIHLGMCLGLLAPTIDEPAVDTLARAASEPWVPSDIRLGALRALEIVARTRGLPSDIVNRIKHAPTTAVRAFFTDVSGDLLAMATHWVLSQTGQADSPFDEVVTYSHNPDWRLRELSIETSANLIRHLGIEDLRWVIHQGLFDESPTVQMASIRNASLLVRSRLWRAARGRLFALLERSEREVRASVVKAAHAISDSDPTASETILLKGASDRSWLIREAARERPGHYGGDEGLVPR